MRKIDELNKYAPFPWNWEGKGKNMSAVTDAQGTLLFGSWIAPQGIPNDIKVHKALVAFVNEVVAMAKEKDLLVKEQLLELLAIIHRDGGHRTIEVGLKQAVQEAKEIASYAVQHTDLAGVWD